MPTFNDPKADAYEAAEALRGLAHATRTFENPSDMYPVLGDVLAGVRALRQVIDQVAAAHLEGRAQAYDDAGSPSLGAGTAVSAAAELHTAGALLDEVHDRLDAGKMQAGKIAWHTEPPSVPPGRALEADAPRTTVKAGRLTLTVWPISPLGEHHRYGYLVEDERTGDIASGRNIYTGTEAVEPDQAMRELVRLLLADAASPKYPLLPEGKTAPRPMFPDTIREATRGSRNVLHTLQEQPITSVSPLREASPSKTLMDTGAGNEKRWINVVFLQGDDADQALQMLDREGTDALIEYLAGYDVGDDTVQAALANGYVYDEPPNGPLDRTATRDVYTLTYNHDFGYVSLLREYDAIPDPALLGIDTPPTVEPGLETISEPQPAGKDRSGSSWFGRSGRSRAPSQGLAL